MKEEKPWNTKDTAEVTRRDTLIKIGLGSVAIAGCGAAAFGYEFLSPNVLYEPSPIANARQAGSLSTRFRDPRSGGRRLHRPRSGGPLRAVGHLHASGLFHGLEAGTRHHRLPLPRQQVQPARREDRRARAQAAPLAEDLDQRRRRSAGGSIHHRDAGSVLEDLTNGQGYRKLLERSARCTKVWRSVFRSGAGSSNLHSALSVQQNVFLHLASVKMRRRSLAFGVTWYLGTLTLATFLILTGTGILLMLYYHPSVPQAYADMKDLQFVVSAGRVSAQSASLVGAGHGVPGVRAHVQGVLPGRISHAARVQLGDRRRAADHHAVPQLHRLSASVGSTGILGHHGGLEYHVRGSRARDRKSAS